MMVLPPLAGIDRSTNILDLVNGVDREIDAWDFGQLLTIGHCHRRKFQGID
jgi:hypothetical protein